MDPGRQIRTAIVHWGETVSDRCQSPHHDRLHPGPHSSHTEPGIRVFVVALLPGREVRLCQDCCQAELAELLRALPPEKQAEWFDCFQIDGATRSARPDPGAHGARLEE